MRGDVVVFSASLPLFVGGVLLIVFSMGFVLFVASIAAYESGYRAATREERRLQRDREPQFVKTMRELQQAHDTTMQAITAEVASHGNRATFVAQPSAIMWNDQ